MTDAKVHPLPQWFESPLPERDSCQRSLFRTTLHKIIAAERVSVDDMRRWKAADLLSFDAELDSEIDEFHDPKTHELQFIRDLVRSGLSDSQIEWLLAQLPKPYAFNPDRIAFSFRHGWVIAAAIVEPDPHEIIEEHLHAWLDDQDEDELRELMERIATRLESLANNDGEE